MKSSSKTVYQNQVPGSNCRADQLTAGVEAAAAAAVGYSWMAGNLYEACVLKY